MRAIEQHLTPARLPPSCHGLSRAEVNFALGRAIYLAAGSGRRKTAWRRQASAAGARLAYLISALPQPARRPRASSAAGPLSIRPAPVNRRPAGLAALATWLITVGSGAAMLGRRFARRALSRLRAGRRRAGPAVLAGHFGLAVAGLLTWACYLATGWLGLAWLAVCLLLPVIGLGMATLAIGAAAPPRVAAWTGHPVRSPAGVAPWAGNTPAGTGAGRAGAGMAASPMVAAALAPQPTRLSPGAGQSRAARRAVILPVAHGLAAMATILLALLTALGAA